MPRIIVFFASYDFVLFSTVVESQRSSLSEFNWFLCSLNNALELSNCGGSVIIVIEASKSEARWLAKGLKIFFLSSSSIAIGTRAIIVDSYPPRT
jgi:hypothetical protein